jgi:hypothetical protein
MSKRSHIDQRSDAKTNETALSNGPTAPRRRCLKIDDRSKRREGTRQHEWKVHANRVRPRIFDLWKERAFNEPYDKRNREHATTLASPDAHVAR